MVAGLLMLEITAAGNEAMMTPARPRGTQLTMKCGKISLSEISGGSGLY